MLFIYKIKKCKYFSNDKYDKIISILIIFSFYFVYVMIENYKYISFEPIYKKINDFENGNIKSFLYTFFIENEISKIKKFWKINRQNQLIDKKSINNYKKKDIPDISVIITIYNQANCFYRALRSVQNQYLKDFEIIIVDDYSTDNSLEILENYQKEDNRIILLKHSYNYGTIKSRSDAVKLAKGKYITILDGDDGFSNENILYNCFNIAKIGDLDIVEFKLVYFKNRYYKRIENNLQPLNNLYNRIIYQPELKYKFIKFHEKDNFWSYLNRNIVSKIIKNELFKQTLKFIGSKFTEDYILSFEDTIMSVSLFILSNSYYLTKENGYYRSKGECTINFINTTRKKCGLNNCIINSNLDSIKYLNFLVEKLNNTKIEGQLIYKELFTIDYKYDLYKTINDNFNYIFIILDKIIKKFIYYSYKQKYRIIALKNKLIQKEIKILNE